MANPVGQITTPEKDTLWYKDAVIYELHVRSFFDSNSDGIGDLPGLTEKLDYLQDFGVNTLWLLPFYPSPLKDDGYDIADYFSINPIYGSMADFKKFMREATERGLRVITELVLNHTSDQHPWFRDSRRASPGSRLRDYYVWNSNPDKYREVRIIFKDFEPSNWAWDPVARAYYWHRFYSHQPDLNFDNPEVRKQILKVLDFWLDLGVSGFRLDAVPYLYEREGTSCESLPETHQYLKMLRAHMDAEYGDRILLAEANQWPEEAVTYFGGGAGDECHMAFHFPVMTRLFMAVQMEDRIPIVDILEQTPPLPETSQWALFLRNHDELTLEMVTDEERDYMYRVYANDLKARINLGIRRRLAPLLGNDRKKIELMNMLLLSLRGTPVIYYGDEIGMGDNIFLGDRNGVRTPMHWSSDKNAGFSRASPQALFLPIILDPEYHYEAVNVEAQQRNPNSLLWWMKRLLALRKRWKAFGRGTIEFLHPDNRKVLAFIRRWENERILVVANLSRFSQAAELDLSEFKDFVPIELFGRSEFALISAKPYFLTLSPHAGFWFSLEKKSARIELQSSPTRSSKITLTEKWEELFRTTGREKLENLLLHFVRASHWFRSADKELVAVRLQETIPLPLNATGRARLVLLAVEFAQGDPEQYLLPLTFTKDPQSEEVARDFPEAIIGRIELHRKKESGLLHDATADPEFGAALADLIFSSRDLKADRGILAGARASAFRPPRNGAVELPPPTLVKEEHHHIGIRFRDQFFLKLFRQLEPGTNSEIEIGQFLSRKNFAQVPTLAGWLEFRRTTGDRVSLGTLSTAVPNSRNAWAHTFDSLGRFFDRVRTCEGDLSGEIQAQYSLITLAESEIPSAIAPFMGTYCEFARLIGQRTGDLHLALSSSDSETDFTPEPFTPFYQRSLYQSMRNRVVENLRLLKNRLPHLPEADRIKAANVLSQQDQLLRTLRSITQAPLHAMRIRCHGHFHLAKLLYTGKDLFIIDFEGNPARPLSERRIKRSPFLDLASMVRSFHYATHSALLHQVELGRIAGADVGKIHNWARLWRRTVSALFLRSYFDTCSRSALFPASIPERELLLRVLLLDKTVDELSHELNRRPDRIQIPLDSILELIRSDKPA